MRSRIATRWIWALVLFVAIGCSSPPQSTVGPITDPGRRPQADSSTSAPPADRGRGMRVVDTARRFLGVPYRFGGEDAGGIDCSGLVMRSFGSVGIEMPRTAAAQAARGYEVSRPDLVAGDLVLFVGSDGGVGHIGIWIGKGRFIHASSSRGVVEEDLRTQWFAQRFVGGRRVLHH